MLGMSETHLKGCGVVDGRDEDVGLWEGLEGGVIRAGIGRGKEGCALMVSLRWFGHIDRMENEEFVKKVYLSSVEGPNRRGRPLGRREDMVKEYMNERKREKMRRKERG